MVVINGDASADAYLITLTLATDSGEQTIVELTDAEIAQMEADRVAYQAEQAAALAAEKAKADAKASAEAKLTALGLTVEEVAALIG